MLLLDKLRINILLLHLERRCIEVAKCDVCNKGKHFGIQVSHSHRRNNKAWMPNVKRVKIAVNGA